MKSINTTYLFSNVEVKLTGRYTTKSKTRQRQEIDVVIYEVKPVDEFDGVWKKWATEDELLEITTMDTSTLPCQT